METFVKKLVGVLSKEELRHIKLTGQKYKLEKGERKDFKLLDYIVKKGDDYDDDSIASRLYGEEGKNSFYRLKNRLNETIEKSLLEMHYGRDDLNLCLSQIQLYRHFYQLNKLDIAIKYLEKAEKIALSANANDQLEIIYSEFIKLAYDKNVNPEEYIEKRKECRQKMLQVQQIDDVLALLKYRIRVTQNLVRKGTEVGDLMEKTLKEVTGKKTADNPDLYFKIYESVSRILLSNNDFERLESYLSVTYEECTKLKLFNKQNHKVKLQMLTYLMNTSFKLKKINQSLEFARLLREGMDEFDKLHKPLFIFYYYNSLANNYTLINKNKAIEYIQEGLADKDIVQNELHTMYLYLQLCIQQFDIREYKNSLKSIQRIYLNKEFNGLDAGFRYKILVIECLDRYELKDYDILEKNVKNIRKKFAEEWQEDQYKNQRVVIEMLAQLVKHVNKLTPEKIRQLAVSTRNELDMDLQSNDLINYGEWLKASFKI